MDYHETKRSRSSSLGSPPPYMREGEGNLGGIKNVVVSEPMDLTSAGAEHLPTAHDDLFSAAEALTQLNHSVTPPPVMSSSSSPLSDHKQAEVPPRKNHKHPLVHRVSQVSKHPIVTNAVKYYESSKRHYARFNYAAEIVEKAAIPVVNKIEVNLNSRHQARKLRREAAAAAATKAGTDTDPSRKKKRKLHDDDHVSIETKRRLQFCLHVLRLANDHINNRVSDLQQKVAVRERTIKEERDLKEKDLQEERDLKEHISIEKNSNVERDSNIEKDSNDTNDLKSQIPPEAQETKIEIVSTVKKIIHLISNFKPSSLSTNNCPLSEMSTSEDLAVRANNNELKSTIRDIILTLPSTIQQSAITSTTSALQANDKIFVFAKESLEMISKLTNVFNNQLIMAEEWVGGENEEDEMDEEATEADESNIPVPTPSDSNESLVSTTEEVYEKKVSPSDTKRLKIGPT